MTKEQTLTFQQAIALAVQCHNAGDLLKAKGIYRQILQADPNQPVALHFLGVIAYQVGKNDTSADFITKAITIKPDYVEAHSNLGNALQKLGKLDEAVASYSNAIAIEPDFAEAHSNLGNAFQELGKLDEAIACYNKAIIIKPNFVEVHNNLGNTLKELGLLDEAVASFNRALAIKPEYAEAHNNLGIVFNSLGALHEAVVSYRMAIAIKPDLAEAYYNLGNVLIELGQLDGALENISKALIIKPDYAEAYFSLGNFLSKVDKLDDAVASFKKAITIKPDYFEAHNNLGISLQDLGRHDEAVASYNKAIVVEPDYAEAYSNLGNTFRDLGRLDEAMASCNKALTINPDFAEAHNNLGNALKELGRLDEAVTSYNKALAVKPDYAEAYCNLSNVLQDQGNIEDAVNQLDLALSYKPEKSGWLTRKALFLPAIPYSQEDIINRRKELSETVLALQDKKLIVEDPLVDIGSTNFYLAYHGQNNRSIMESIAKLHISVCPKLTFEAEHCRRKQVRKDGRLQIGFLSSYFKEHSVGKLSRGLIEHFSREIFEVIVFHLPGKKDAVTEAIVQSADRSVLLSRNLEKDRVSIAEQELDCLLYLDIGMDPYTYFLSFARLAPVQAMTWGHPDTTGIPNIDYFISSDSIEPPEASRHYTETLIKLSLMPTYLYYPDIPTQNYERAGFSLKNQGSLYLCPQSLFKLHPSYDATLAELLRSDPEGLLIFIDDNKGGHWKKLFIERLSRSYPDVVDRVTFVPKMPYEKFLGLLSLADAILDVPTFSGGVSSLEAFAMGAPIVTWPGEFMRGRVTSGYYKQMGLDDLIASNENEYVSLAIKLAHDPDFKNQMKNDIKENSHKLFERIEVVREMENFFLSAYEQMCEG